MLFHLKNIMIQLSMITLLIAQFSIEITHTLVIDPFIGAIIASITQIFIAIILLWKPQIWNYSWTKFGLINKNKKSTIAEKSNKEKEGIKEKEGNKEKEKREKEESPIKEIQNIKYISISILIEYGLALLGFIGIFLLDIALFWWFGALTYNDWWFHLPTIILITYIGIEYSFGVYLGKVNVIRLIFWLLGFSVLIWFFHLFIPKFDVMGIPMEEYAGKIMGLIILLFWIGGILARFTQSKFNIVDINKKLKRVFGLEVNFIVWMLITIQTCLNFLGYSLFG